MGSRDVAAMLEELVSAEPHDYASMLIDLQAEGAEEDQDFVAEVLSVYQDTIEFYASVEAIYESTVQVLNPPEVGAFTTTTNR